MKKCIIDFIKIGSVLIFTLTVFISCTEQPLDLRKPRFTAEQFTKAFIEEDIDLLKKIKMNELDIESFCLKYNISIGKFRKTDFGEALLELEEGFTDAYMRVKNFPKSNYKIETYDIDDEEWGIEYKFYLIFEEDERLHFELFLVENDEGNWKVIGFSNY